jgi:hypothetical protein
MYKVLSDGLLPPGYYAFTDQSSGRIGSDVMVSPRMLADVDESVCNSRRIAIRHERDDRTVAIVEVVSPQIKNSAATFQRFIKEALGMLFRQVHLLIVELQSPTPHDSMGIHNAIWSAINPDEQLTQLNKPLTLVSYSADQPITAYLDPIAVGDILRDMPLFVAPERYVSVPLESTYMTTWQIMPPHVKAALEK